MICYVEIQSSYDNEIIEYAGFYSGEDEIDVVNKIKSEFGYELLKFSIEIIAPDHGLVSSNESIMKLIKELKTEYEKDVIW